MKINVYVKSTALGCFLIFTSYTYGKSETSADLNYIVNYCRRVFASMELSQNRLNILISEISKHTVSVEPKRNIQSEEILVNTTNLYARFNYKTKALTSWAFEIENKINANPVKIPRMSICDAIDMAKNYLKCLEVELPSEVSLKTAQFNRNYKNCWEIRWEPTYGGYAYDDFVSAYEQSLAVVFHEIHGLYFYGGRLNFPAPKYMTVNILKEDAIRRADKVAPLVMKTPYYQMCRMPGFKVSGLDKAELLVSAPNWLLDPKRAVWIREKIPEESRLCWVVTLLTVDTVERKDGMTPIPPKIVVYVDAATGEIVGANFT